ncbi:MarR family winged helix-turn-helix transcriptional regulator [Companilactobacillus halodurans]|uniref:MarR family transcriptional regulator n=1 Tax=Companilactobacillus halodurans TaxID=2584183 RepID=A0A5P0ZZX0_9LACO|nr:helix-turn-helix domain-containing protein [Companilactobacillus halodurans]MQS75313.1 MarR family transcriptional regulator [Companilactobacillus halodurans]MQS98570.1 MarR family transcriptional regulator [Companilactobacillus halodurans]
MKNSLGVMLKQANNALARDVDHFAKTIGLTGMQIYAINFISDNEERDIFQRDLEHEFNIRKATASDLVSKMVKNDLLIRVPALHDARYKRLLLTAKSRRLENQIEKFFEKSEQRLHELLLNNFDSVYQGLSQIPEVFSDPTSEHLSNETECK